MSIGNVSGQAWSFPRVRVSVTLYLAGENAATPSGAKRGVTLGLLVRLGSEHQLKQEHGDKQRASNT